MPIREANGSSSCVQNVSCGLDTLSEIWGTTCDHPLQKGRFLHVLKATTLTVSSALIYTRGAAIPHPRDTAAAVGQLCAYIFFLRGTPWELQPPKLLNFNSEVRIWRQLLTTGTRISWLLSEIMVDNTPDQRSAEYQLPSLITASTTGTQTWLATQYWHFSRC